MSQFDELFGKGLSPEDMEHILQCLSLDFAITVRGIASSGSMEARQTAVKLLDRFVAEGLMTVVATQGRKTPYAPAAGKRPELREAIRKYVELMQEE